MKIDARDILERLEKEERVRRTFFISDSIYKAFQSACGKMPASNVVEELMRQFVESAKSGKKSD